MGGWLLVVRRPSVVRLPFPPARTSILCVRPTVRRVCFGGVLCNATPVNRTGGARDQYPRAIPVRASRTTLALSLAKWFGVHRYGQQTYNIKTTAEGHHNDLQGCAERPIDFLPFLRVYVRDHLITLW